MAMIPTQEVKNGKKRAEVFQDTINNNWLTQFYKNDVHIGKADLRSKTLDEAIIVAHMWADTVGEAKI